MFPAVLPTYNRTDIAFVRGEGSYLFAEDGRRYLDFGAGIAVNAFGYNNPKLVGALTEQAGKLWHTSNLYRVPGQESLAAKLVAHTFADTVFFTNSGAEACELAFKMARRYHFVNGNPERFHIVSFEGAFHGRTLAGIAAGGNEKYLEGFGPKLAGFDQAEFTGDVPRDMDALKAVVSEKTAALIIEPIQGEGGVRPVAAEFLRALRKLCDEKGLILIFDEIQTGMGRTGKLFAHEWAGIEPDIMCIAKGIGGGFPLGATLATAEAAKGMTVGTHGTTYGGNPLAMAVGNAAIDLATAPGFLDHVNKIANYLNQQLGALVAGHPGIFDGVRGQGMMLGLKMKIPGGDFITAAREAGLVVLPAGDNVVRLLPPLTLSESEAREGVELMGKAAAALETKVARAMNAPIQNIPKHFLDLSDHDSATLKAIIADAKHRKAARVGLAKGIADADAPLEGRVLAMIFDKQSTRTRISFDVAMRQLGGTTLMLTGNEMQLAREETIADTARVISRYVDAIMIRLLDHEMVEELAANASIPVINGLTKWSHPAQVMADVMTFEEHRGPIAGATVAWSGDSNNVLTSWVHAAKKFDFTLRVAAPRELPADPEVTHWARGARIEFGHDPEAAVKDADCVVSDAWVSMGDDNATKRHNLLKPYQVNGRLMRLAKKDAIFMHCLPAHRGEEVTDEVIDGPQSVVFDEAENRLHAQKAILAWALR